MARWCVASGIVLVVAIVIDEATGDPVPGAEVTWFDWRCDELVSRMPVEEQYHRAMGSLRTHHGGGHADR